MRKHKIVQLVAKETQEEDQSIVRHRTPIVETPYLPLLNYCLPGLASEDNFFGLWVRKGDDVKFLNELGINAKGWDPYFKPDNKNLIASDIVNLALL